MSSNKSVASGLGWKLLERFGVQGIQFVLQIILARILDPELYGVLAIMVIFTTLANVFIQTGFNTALVQNKDVTEEDYSSVLWVTLGITVILYGVIYFCAPLIARFYEMPGLVKPLRVLALMLFPGAINSVQLAKVSRELDFRKVFYSNIGGVLIAGILGVVIALQGGGLWALVIQTLINTLVACIVMSVTVKLRIRFVCNLRRVRELFSFGWRLLVSGLIDTLYQDLSSLIIGKKYTAETLAYNTRGKQFPQFVITAINSAVQSVLLPAMSAKQSDTSQVKTLMRTSVVMSSYIIFPMMAGLAAVASPLVRLLLTDKWIECVPYLQIYCFTQAFMPVQTSNLQAINAMGRSDIFLKLEVVKKIIGISSLVFVVVVFDSPLAIAASGIVITLISFLINAAPNKELVGYSYLEQIRDILPSFLLAMSMFGLVLLIQLLGLAPILTLIIQILFGVVYYVGISAVFRLEPYCQFLRVLKNLKSRHSKQ